MPGRGGAGNYQNANREIGREDVEAVRTAQHRPIEPDQLPSNAGQQYAHTGRGGAGNYYSPQELNSTGTFVISDKVKSSNEAGTSQSTANPNSAAASAPVRKFGRGGAGNLMYGVTEDEQHSIRRDLDEKQKQDKVKADVEATVQAAISEPPKAKLLGSYYE